jgi:hypothetical protein
MQHTSGQMGSQTGFPKQVMVSVSSISKLIEKNFTAALANVRPNLLTIDLITLHRGAA